MLLTKSRTIHAHIRPTISDYVEITSYEYAYTIFRLGDYSTILTEPSANNC